MRMDKFQHPEELEDQLLDAFDTDELPIELGDILRTYQQNTVEATKAFVAHSILPGITDETLRSQLRETILSLSITVN